MRLFALAFGALVLIAAIVLVGGEGDRGLLPGTNPPAPQHAAPAKPVARVAQPAPAPMVDETADEPDAQDFASDEDLIDDTAGIDSSGFEPSPMIQTDPARADDLGETAIVSQPGAANEPPPGPAGPGPQPGAPGA